MLDRCLNPKSRGYKNYGRRGITVSPEWQASFETFVNDMGPRPKGHTLDRVDNNKGYSKYNCRWATSLEQCFNTKVKKQRTFTQEKTSIRKLLLKVHTLVELRNEPQPSVFVDHEPAARFFGADWDVVFELVLFYVTMKYKQKHE